MNDPLFMSPQHVAAMNAILAGDPSVRAACAALTKPVTVVYELSDGPDGATVRWCMSFTDTVRFGLDGPADADLVLRGDWARMIRAAQANRAGRVENPGLITVGDPTVMQAIAPIVTVASEVATLPVEFPNI